MEWSCHHQTIATEALVHNQIFRSVDPYLFTLFPGTKVRQISGTSCSHREHEHHIGNNSVERLQCQWWLRGLPFSAAAGRWIRLPIIRDSPYPSTSIPWIILDAGLVGILVSHLDSIDPYARRLCAGSKSCTYIALAQSLL